MIEWLTSIPWLAIVIVLLIGAIIVISEAMNRMMNARLLEAEHLHREIRSLLPALAAARAMITEIRRSQTDLPSP
jgi:hypothetical protein